MLKSWQGHFSTGSKFNITQPMYQRAKISLAKTDIAKQIMCAIARYAN